MRRRILDTTLACLATAGWAGTTTTAVVDGARISRGALLHHYPTRAALIAAAVRDLFSRLRSDFENAFAEVPRDEDRPGRAIGLLWEIYCRPDLEAVLELEVAARVDAELRGELARVAAEHQERVFGLARQHFPGEAGDRLESVLGLVLDALQGMAVRRAVRPDPARDRRSLRFLQTVVASVLAGGPTGPVEREPAQEPPS